VNAASAQSYVAMADEASKCPLYGAIYYCSDIEVGMEMGKKIGEKAVQKAKTDGADWCGLIILYSFRKVIVEAVTMLTQLK